MENILKAKKQGFNSPDQNWFKGDSLGLAGNNLLN